MRFIGSVFFTGYVCYAYFEEKMLKNLDNSFVLKLLHTIKLISFGSVLVNRMALKSDRKVIFDRGRFLEQG